MLQKNLSHRSGSTPSDGANCTITATGAGDDRVAVAASEGALRERRVLLIEDDPAFNEVTKDYLVECGYTVVAVQSGAEGVREVIASNFALIFCDMAMPKMRGDMFYRAVERVRPQLCKRFVFMTGYREDARTSVFIKEVGTYVLRKPFPLQHLVDTIAFFEVLNTYRSVLEEEAASPVVSHVRPSDDPYLVSAASFRASPVSKTLAPDRKSTPLQGPVQPSESDNRAREAAPSMRAEVVPRLFSPAPVAVLGGPVHPPERARPAVERRGTPGGSFFRKSGCVALLVALAAVQTGRHMQLRARAAASSAELLVCEQQWPIAFSRLQEAEGKRRGAEAAVNRAKHITAEFNAPALEQALRSVTTAAGENVELRDIEVRREPDGPAEFHLRISGVCNGREPRARADRFRRMIEVKLERFSAKEGVMARFERLEDAAPPLSELSGQRNTQAAFTIIATSGRSKK